MQTIRSLGNTINIARVTIDEKEQSIARSRQKLDEEKVKLDKLVNDKKFAQYNESIGEYNELVDNLNQSIEEYDELIELHNQNVKIVNDLIVKSGTRKYLFPIDEYTPELYREIK
jgi:predicted  nucleic acid-binding Zn-ribbon protein